MLMTQQGELREHLWMEGPRRSYLWFSTEENPGGPLAGVLGVSHGKQMRYGLIWNMDCMLHASAYRGICQRSR